MQLKKVSAALLLTCMLSLPLAAQAGPNAAVVPAPASTFVPVLPKSPPVVLMHESSGELWRKTHLNQDGTIARLEVGYQDGRYGVFSYDHGILRSFKSRNELGRVHYEADFDLSGFIVSSRTFNGSGELTESYRRLPDGQTETLKFDAQGRTVQARTVLPDGSVKTVSQPDATQPAQVDIQTPVASEKTFSGGNGEWKVQYLGEAVKSWEFTSNDGKSNQKGFFRQDGSFELTVMDPYGRPSFRQVWQPCGQDWQMTFYRLSKIEEFDWNGGIGRSTELRADGKTALKSVKYYNGNETSKEDFDKQGFRIRYQYRNYDGSWGSISEDNPKSPYRPQLVFSAPYTEIPSDNGVPLYRVQGSPFSSLPGSPLANSSSFFKLK